MPQAIRGDCTDQSSLSAPLHCICPWDRRSQAQCSSATMSTRRCLYGMVWYACLNSHNFHQFHRIMLYSKYKCIFGLEVNLCLDCVVWNGIVWHRILTYPCSSAETGQRACRGKVASAMYIVRTLQADQQGHQMQCLRVSE